MKKEGLGKFIIRNIMNDDGQLILETLLSRHGSITFDYINITKTLAQTSDTDLLNIINEWKQVSKKNE